MPYLPPLPPSHPRLTGGVAHVQRVQHAPPRPPTAVRAAQQGGALVWLPVNEDDPTVAPTHSVRIPRSELHLDAHGNALPETDRVRVVESEYWVKLNTDGPDATMSDPRPNPFRDGRTSLPGRVELPPQPFSPARSEKAHPRVPAYRALTPWMLLEGLDSGARQIIALTQRDLRWGRGGQLTVYPHAYSTNDSAYLPENRSVMLGVVPAYDRQRHQPVWFEEATSRDLYRHEAFGHALEHAWKPTLWIHTAPVLGSAAPSVYAEAQGDLMATWLSLLEPGRAEAVLRETHGDLKRSNAASRLAEFMGQLDPDGPHPSLRDAVNVEGTHRVPGVIAIEGEHEASEVVSGALYDVFTDDVLRRRGSGPASASDVRAAAADAVRLLARAIERLPENTFDDTDVLRAYLDADQVLFHSVHSDSLKRRFQERGLCSEAMVAQRPAFPVPALTPPGADASPAAWNGWLAENARALGTPEGFSLRMESGERTLDGRFLLRTQLRVGQGAGAIPLYQHGMLELGQGKLVRVQPAFPRGADPLKALVAVASAPGLSGTDPRALPILIPGEHGTVSVVVVRTYPESDVLPLGARHPLQGVTAIRGTEVLNDLTPVARKH